MHKRLHCGKRREQEFEVGLAAVDGHLELVVV
jgi:hypothetical protein